MISASYAKVLALKTVNLEKIEEKIRKACSEGNLRISVRMREITQAERCELEDLGYTVSPNGIDYDISWNTIKTE